MVYELLCPKGKLKPERKKIIEIYHTGLRFYRDRKWEEAIENFSEVLNRNSNDSPSTTYLKRCREYRQHPPDKSWNGIYVLNEK